MGADSFYGVSSMHPGDSKYSNFEEQRKASFDCVFADCTVPFPGPILEQYFYLTWTAKQTNSPGQYDSPCRGEDWEAFDPLIL